MTPSAPHQRSFFPRPGRAQTGREAWRLRCARVCARWESPVKLLEWNQAASRFMCTYSANSCAAFSRITFIVPYVSAVQSEEYTGVWYGVESVWGDLADSNVRLHLLSTSITHLSGTKQHPRKVERTDRSRPTSSGLSALCGGSDHPLERSRQSTQAI